MSKFKVIVFLFIIFSVVFTYGIAPMLDLDTKDTVEVDLNAEVLEKIIFRLTNEERESQGVEPLILDEDRSAFARAHSQDMVENDYLSTLDLNGDAPGDRIRAAHGFGYVSVPLDNGRYLITGISENVGKLDAQSNSIGARRFVDLWMESPENKVAILDTYYDHDLMGIGCVKNNNNNNNNQFLDNQYVCTQDLYRLNTVPKKRHVAEQLVVLPTVSDPHEINPYGTYEIVVAYKSSGNLPTAFTYEEVVKEAVIFDIFTLLILSVLFFFWLNIFKQINQFLKNNTKFKKSVKCADQPKNK